jgi:hypothetical protein
MNEQSALACFGISYDRIQNKNNSTKLKIINHLYNKLNTQINHHHTNLSYIYLSQLYSNSSNNMFGGAYIPLTGLPITTTSINPTTIAGISGLSLSVVAIIAFGIYLQYAWKTAKKDMIAKKDMTTKKDINMKEQKKCISLESCIKHNINLYNILGINDDIDIKDIVPTCIKNIKKISYRCYPLYNIACKILSNEDSKKKYDVVYQKNKDSMIPHITEGFLKTCIRELKQMPIPEICNKYKLMSNSTNKEDNLENAINNLDINKTHLSDATSIEVLKMNILEAYRIANKDYHPYTTTYTNKYEATKCLNLIQQSYDYLIDNIYDVVRHYNKAIQNLEDEK